MSDTGIEQRLDEITKQLHQIHTLVNSNLTASMRAELEATVRDAASLREVIAIKKISGLAPSPEAAQQLEATDARVAELRASIGDRLQATEIAEAEARE
jgi:hypothetical protein